MLKKERFNHRSILIKRRTVKNLFFLSPQNPLSFHLKIDWYKTLLQLFWHWKVIKKMCCIKINHHRLVWRMCFSLSHLIYNLTISRIRKSIKSMETRFKICFRPYLVLSISGINIFLTQISSIKNKLTLYDLLWNKSQMYDSNLF